MIQVDYPVFSNYISLVSRLVEVSLAFYCVGIQSANQADLDNQMITYININPKSGVAPSEWRSHVGTVIVARKDKKTLLS